MTEYVLIIVVVAIAALAVMKVFGKQIRGLFTHASQEVAASKAP